VTWSKPIYSGEGKTITTLGLPPKTVTRFLRVVQKTAQGGFWSIHELSVYGAAPQ
jgi:hypothetical protein